MVKRKKRMKTQQRSSKEKEKRKLEINFGIGKLSLGGLFKGIEKLVDLAADLKDIDTNRLTEVAVFRKAFKEINSIEEIISDEQKTKGRTGPFTYRR